jgi:hypothetical protein
MTNPSASLKKNLFRTLAHTCTSVTSHSLKNLTCRTLLISSSSIQGEYISKHRRLSTNNIQTSTATLHLSTLNKFNSYTHARHTEYSSKPLLLNCPTSKLVHLSPYEQIQIKCTNSLSPCTNVIITVELLSSQRHFEAQKDGHPKVLSHNCGGCCNTSLILVWSFRPCGMLHGHG